MSIKILTKDNFESEVINSDKPVLIDFWATWCGPCKMFAPTVEEFANEHDDVVVGKVDIDNEPELATKYGVMSIPTAVLFKNGEPVSKSVGLVPKSKLEEMIK